MVPGITCLLVAACLCGCEDPLCPCLDFTFNFLPIAMRISAGRAKRRESWVLPEQDWVCLPPTCP